MTNGQIYHENKNKNNLLLLLTYRCEYQKSSEILAIAQKFPFTIFFKLKHSCTFGQWKTVNYTQTSSVKLHKPFFFKIKYTINSLSKLKIRAEFEPK